MTSKANREFRRESRDGKYCYVKKLSSGGEIHRDEEMFAAFDSRGAFLGGLISDQEQAEHAANNGFVVSIGIDSGVSELDLWPLWNTAVAWGCRVMLGDDGWQVIGLTDQIFLLARRAHTFGGYDVELATDSEINDRYFDEDNGCFRITVCPKASVIELE